MTEEGKKIAKTILKEIKTSKHVLLHCHPYADPDSVGSVIALSLALKKMGIKTTAIMGDSTYPKNLLALPKHDLIIQKKYSEINAKEYDLFIILDSSRLGQVTQLQEVVLPKGMRSIVIDHHVTNERFGNFNLVDGNYSSTCEILFDLFVLWKIEIDEDMAMNLFIGIYADTGGFMYQNTTADTLLAASKLARINKNFSTVIFEMDNNKDPQEVEFTGLALSSIEKYFSGDLVMAAVPYGEIKKRGISKENTQVGIANTLRSVIGWNIAINLVETAPNEVTVNLRTRDPEKYDVSLVAKAIGNGGGHKAAAGTTIYCPFGEAKERLLAVIKKTFPQLPD